MADVWIPALLQDLTEGQEKVSVFGQTVGELLVKLEALYPGIARRLCEDDGLRPGFAVSVDGEVQSEGLRCRVAEESEVHFLPAISGGCHVDPISHQPYHYVGHMSRVEVAQPLG